MEVKFMKKALKSVSLILALVLCISAFTSCSKKEEVSLDDVGSLTYWGVLYTTSAETLKSYNEMLMYQEISKATGIDVEFIHPSAGASAASEAFQIMLASEELPDMIEANWATYSGGPEQAINDGVIIKLNDYMEEYAPNYYDYMEGEKGKANFNLYKKQSITANGNYYGFKSLASFNNKVRNYGGLYVRKDKLDEWGLDIPKTIDDWDLVFETAKKNGFERPFTTYESVFNLMKTGINTFSGAWGVGQQYYIDNGKVKYGPFEPEYKEYVAKMAEWYKKGYIDPDFITNDTNEMYAAIIHGKSIASYGFVGSALGVLIPAIKETHPDSDFELAACPYPVLKEGEMARFSNPGVESSDPTLAITVQCGKDNPDRYLAAIKWSDYLYSDEGAVLATYGVEGITHTVEVNKNGEKEYKYTDTIIDHEKIGAHSIDASKYHFMRPANAPGTRYLPESLKDFYVYKEQVDAVDVWNENIAEAKRTYWSDSTMSYSAEDAGRIAEIKAKTGADIAAGILDIIIGKKSIDTYDALIKKVKKAGLGEIIEIYQKYYDLYDKY